MRTNCFEGFEWVNGRVGHYRPLQQWRSRFLRCLDSACLRSLCHSGVHRSTASTIQLPHTRPSKHSWHKTIAGCVEVYQTLHVFLENGKPVPNHCTPLLPGEVFPPKIGGFAVSATVWIMLPGSMQQHWRSRWLCSSPPKSLCWSRPGRWQLLWLYSNSSSPEGPHSFFYTFHWILFNTAYTNTVFVT